MITNQYYTTRRNTYNNPITVLDELLVHGSSGGLPSHSYNWTSGSLNIPVNYIGTTIKLTQEPKIGQLIVITLFANGINNQPYAPLNVSWLTQPPRVGQYSDPGTEFNLACVGGLTNYQTPESAHQQVSIWYRTVDALDITEWNSGRGYGVLLSQSASAALFSASLTQLSHGQYWTTPINSAISYDNGSGAYSNTTFTTTGLLPGYYARTTYETSLNAGSPTGVNVGDGGIIIAGCTVASGTEADPGASSPPAPYPSVDNSFSLVPSQQYQYGASFTHVVAKRQYTSAATNQNVTFINGVGRPTTTAIAAFNQ